jgi:hypothetical protein
MSNALERFCLTRDVRIPYAVELSVFKGVGGWGWPMSIRACRMGTSFCALMKAAPSSASDAAAMTCRMRVLSMCTAPFSFTFWSGCLGRSARWKNPPALLRAPYATRYAASLSIHSSYHVAVVESNGRIWVGGCII